MLPSPTTLLVAAAKVIAATASLACACLLVAVATLI